MDPLDPLLRAIPPALDKLRSGQNAVRSQLVAMEAAESARHNERMRMAQVVADAQKAQASAVRAALKVIGKVAPPEDNQDDDENTEQDPRVTDAVVTLKVNAIGKANDALNAPESIAAWFQKDSARTLLFFGFVGGVVSDLATGAGVLSALGRGLLTLAATSTGSAP